VAGKTLLVSRSVNNHAFFKKRLEALGFRQVTVTDLEKDALFFLIREIKPNILIMGASFYSCSTPYLMGELHKKFPKIYMAAVSIGNYPVDLAMYFIINGINSYVNFFEGYEQFYKGLDKIANGIDYVSTAVLESLATRKEKPDPVKKLSEKQIEIIRLICCGYREYEIADELAISRNTVYNHKTDFCTSLNVRNDFELFYVARILGIANFNERYFYPKNLTVNPLPIKQFLKRRKK